MYKRKFIEMANVGSVKGLNIQVYTDHKPEHFHIIKKDNFELKVKIKTLSFIEYKWQKNGSEISSSEWKAVLNWLSKLNNKNKKLTNYEAIKFLWSSMNR